MSAAPRGWRRSLMLALVILPGVSIAQIEPVGVPDQRTLLASTDPVLAENKRLVFDFWREVLEAGHLEQVDRFLDPGYIQHNPETPSGREGFVRHFAGRLPVRPIQPAIAKPVAALIAEGDLVTLATVRHPCTATGTTGRAATYFDMFRVRDGRILEHWDAGVPGERWCEPSVR